MQGERGGTRAGTGGPGLSPGTRLDNRYTIERMIAAGGFGITYAARHDALGRTVAIKEHFPRQLAHRDATTDRVVPTEPATYRWALDRFMDEGRALARCRHPNVVEVSDVFEANGTAYMVLGFEEGASLSAWLEAIRRPPTQAELDRVLVPLLDALEAVHGQGMLHRDIAPDNIMLRPDGTPCLIDFGAARQAIAGQSQALSAIVKSGYSPPEQYTTSGRAQGPWSDIYALGATLWRCVTGQRPPEATDRMIGDRLGSVADEPGVAARYRAGFLAGIDAALRLRQIERPQTVGAWRPTMLDGAGRTTAPITGAAARATRGGGNSRKSRDGGRAAGAVVASQEPVSFSTLPPSAAAQGPTGRLPAFLAAAAVLVGLAGAALWYWSDRGREQRSTEPPRPAPSAPAPSAPAPSAPAPALRPLPPVPAGSACRQLDVVRCNTVPGCEWRVNANACLATAPSPAAVPPLVERPAERTTSPPAATSDCARHDVVRCNSVAGCEWRIISRSCVSTPSPPAAPGQAADRCANLRTRAVCNAATRCLWSDARSTCVEAFGR